MSEMVATTGPYAPKSYVVLQPGDDGYGKFHAHILFEAEPCPEQQKYKGLDVNKFGKWSHIKKGDPKPDADGNPSKRKKESHDGHILTGGVVNRLSACEKLLQWREKSARKLLKEDEAYKKSHMITLIEKEPCGLMTEGGRWASKIDLLKHFLTRQMPGSQITIEVDCAPNPSLLMGYYTPWYQTIENIHELFPDNIVVKVLDDSILTADPVTFYPSHVDPEHPHKGQVDRERIDRSFDFCRNFVNCMRTANSPPTTPAGEPETQAMEDPPEGSPENPINIDLLEETTGDTVAANEKNHVNTHSTVSLEEYVPWIGDPSVSGSSTGRRRKFVPEE